MKLEVRNVQCGFDDKPLLRYINFSIESGEICCILGPNGVGKSTLFKAILGLIPLQKGEVLIDGENIAHWSAAKLSSVVAYVSQTHTPPFPYQVKDVVMMGRIAKVPHSKTPKRMDYCIVDGAIEDMGLSALRDESYTDISGGELQMVMIARALAQQPSILLLDEPTAALDYGNAVRVISRIRELAKRGYAIIMTTHSPDHAFLCESKVVLLERDAPMIFGRAIDVITEKNMKQAYGVRIKVVEFVNERQKITRRCAPVFQPLEMGI